jgi:hypothetical protein
MSSQGRGCSNDDFVIIRVVVDDNNSVRIGVNRKSMLLSVGTAEAIMFSRVLAINTCNVDL